MDAMPVASTTTEIPESWIKPRLAGVGFLPDIGVHRRGEKVYQETSRSVAYGAGVLLAAAVLALIPLETWGLPAGLLPYFVQIVVSLGCVWAAICALFGSRFIASEFGLRVECDLSEKSVLIEEAERRVKIKFSQIIAVQILAGPKGVGGHQVNLVYRLESGEVAREHLATHALRHYVARLARAYSQHVGWPILSPV